MKRRAVLGLAASALAAAGGASLAWRFWPVPTFEFEPVPSLPGFRRLPRCDGLSSGAFLTGLDGPSGTPAQLSEAEVCERTFHGVPTGGGDLAIAIFSDFFCPYCRVLDVEVRALAGRYPRARVIPHEVPLLCVPSEFAARGVRAAAAQGAYEAFHARLIRTTFVPNPAYLRDLARSEGLDVAQFSRDLNSGKTQRHLSDAAVLFRSFGFVGTPALVVGRTLVNGTISRRDLRALMDLEQARALPLRCG
ncbi:MAG: DsbA family protein [Pseudomonadota bacterium]